MGGRSKRKEPLPGDSGAGLAGQRAPVPGLTDPDVDAAPIESGGQKVYLGVRVKMPVRDLLRKIRIDQGRQPQDFQKIYGRQVKADGQRVKMRAARRTYTRKRCSKSLEELAIIVEVLEEDLRAGPTCRSPPPSSPNPMSPNPMSPNPMSFNPLSPNPLSPNPMSPNPVSPNPLSPNPMSPNPMSFNPPSPNPLSPNPLSPNPLSPNPLSPNPLSPNPLSPNPLSPNPMSPNPMSFNPPSPNPLSPNPLSPNPMSPNPMSFNPASPNPLSPQWSSASSGYNSDESDDMIPSPGGCGASYWPGAADERADVWNQNNSTFFWSQLQREEGQLEGLTAAALLATDQLGKTALHQVACVGKRALGYALAKRMAAVNSLDLKDADGMTPLLLAAKHNHHLMVADLILLGANVNEADGSGKTCLHLSAERGFTRVLEVLKNTMLAGVYVDVEATDNSGMSVLQCASVALKAVVRKLECSRSPNPTRLHTLRREQMLETLECLLQMGSYYHLVGNRSLTPRSA